jgi:hypothetical protein
LDGLGLRVHEKLGEIKGIRVKEISCQLKTNKKQTGATVRAFGG